MLELSIIRENKELVIKGLKKKNFANAESEIDSILLNDKLRRETQTKLDEMLSESNTKAKLIGGLMKEGKREEAEQLKVETSAMKAEINSTKELLDKIAEDLTNGLYHIPNTATESVPEGFGEKENEVISEHGDIPKLDEKALPHWELIQKYDIIDFELGNKITGAGFPVYKGKGAKLQRALINFFLDSAEDEGYREIQSPILINSESGYGTGQLPDKDGQMYHVDNDNLYLIPTGEVPITNMYRDVIVDPNELPIKNAGYTPCFRREAGSWGADVRGLNRLHQFDKVEIVQLSLPSESYKLLEEMRSYIESLIAKLGLPYRVLNLCGGDLGFTSAKTYDMEVYSAAQSRWLEVSSVSNFETYQANRLKLRYKDENKKSHLLHTLNGSALALPRILAAILENNQTADGIIIPEVLRSYTGFDKIS